MGDFDYSTCHFEARLQKEHFLRRKEWFYLYVSATKIIINTEPYCKKPTTIIELLPTTHVKWLWDNNWGRHIPKLRGFIIETEGQMQQFVAEKVVLYTLKEQLQRVTLQSEFYEEYVLGKYIDRGNYAQVYECVKKDNGQKRAVKVLQKERLKTMRNGKESVFNELKILRCLDHQNLMRLFEVFEDRSRYYFVLQLLQGTTLQKQIHARKKKNNFQPHQIKAVMKQLLSALDYLHERNIMHRDVKPQNILFDSREALDRTQPSGLKLVDYGLATYQHEPVMIFTKCGTPGFVAPEVITYDEKGPIYGVNVDTFSVGVILHMLLLGEQCFVARSRNTILNKNKQCRIDYKTKKYEQLAADPLDLLSRLLEKNPQKRIKPSEALLHAFFTKDKPLFKFRKTYIAPNIDTKPMKVYRDLTEFQQQDECLSPSKQLPPNPCLVSYQQNLSFFDPFSYDSPKKSMIESVEEIEVEPLETQPVMIGDQDAIDLFYY